MKLTTCLIVAFLASFVSGCLDGADDGIESEHVETAESAVVMQNSLNLNALNLNALNLNALNLNALNLDALHPSALAAIKKSGPQGDLARELIRYSVSCAFDPTQSFSFSWTDDQDVVHNETYEGLLGLAPNWETGPLAAADEEWVSACLISRVNWYGTSVMISSRGSHENLNQMDPDEDEAYAKQEGAFWGNLFESPPRASACTYTQNIDYSRSQMRDCAAGHLEPNGDVVECGIIEIVGSCAVPCGLVTPAGKYYSGCAGPEAGSYTSNVITVWLHD
jgi:hypothetical protein